MERQSIKKVSNSKIEKFTLDNRDYVTSLGAVYSNFTEALS